MNNILNIFEQFYGLHKGDRIAVEGYHNGLLTVAEDGLLNSHGAVTESTTLELFRGEVEWELKEANP